MNKRMKYKRTGVIRSSEVSEISFEGFKKTGILLRPEAGWRYPITVGKEIMLTLPDRSSYYPKVTGGEIMTSDPGIAIELIPAIGNQVPEGTRVYVDNDSAEDAKRWALENKGYKP